jgi:2-polyprenyl-3-methyl-5-hydroxy-6-metoxy-1,4-benzoquinol methylase
MKSLDESIARSMDCEQMQIIPYLPYILQDFEEIGSSSNSILALIKKHQKNYTELKVLDLGCGKGAVSIKIANELKCSCLGIDGISEFINDAQQNVEKQNLSHLCIFEINDIRIRIVSLPNFDVIILGSIGDVFGDTFATLSKVSKKLNENGILIIDDGYLSDDSLPEKKKKIIECGNQLGVPLVDEIIVSDKKKQHAEYDRELELISKRCNELIEKKPAHKKLFLDYIQKQKEEYEVLKNDFISSTMVFKKELNLTTQI